MENKTQEEIKPAKKTFMPVNKEKSIRLKVDENGNEYYDMSPKDPEYFKKYYHRHKPVPTPYPHFKKMISTLRIMILSLIHISEPTRPY